MAEIAALGPVPRSEPRPDFLIIGAPKCGTSWLQGVLAQHPNILMVPEEIEYFSQHLDYPLEWYLDQFAQGLASANAAERGSYLRGEKSARYCSISSDRIRLVHQLFPDARLILMTRDPVARHWSHAKRYYSKRHLTKKEGGVLAVPQDELFAYFSSTRHLSEFSTMVANWTAVFPREQLLVISQERTLAEPRATFDTVLDHIGAPKNYDPTAISFLTEQKNRGPKVEMPEHVGAFLEDMFASERARLKELMGERVAVQHQA